MLIGVWIVAGVVPSMILYGLDLLSPKVFLPAAVLICSITSLATGTLWGTAGTMGVIIFFISLFFSRISHGLISLYSIFYQLVWTMFGWIVCV